MTVSRYVIPTVLPALCVATMAFALPSAAAAGTSAECGISRLCIPASAVRLIDDQMAYQQKKRNLERNLAIVSLKADISVKRKKNAEALQSLMPTPVPPEPVVIRVPAPPDTPDAAPDSKADTEASEDVVPTEKPAEKVSANFPSFRGARNGNPKYPFPRDLTGPLSASGTGQAAPPQPFRVSGISGEQAIVEIYGDPRIVEPGDAVPMGTISSIGFDGIVVSTGSGRTRHIGVDW